MYSFFYYVIINLYNKKGNRDFMYNNISRGWLILSKLLEVNNLNKYFGKKHVLKDVSFSLNEGEILGFIGPNGAGKTTAIKCILGLQRIGSGNVTINGFDVVKDFSKAINKVGAIVESPDMYMYLSGRRNLEMIARMYKGITKEKIDEVIKLVGLEARINDKVSKYSLGMRQRLGIAAALIHNPNLLILDEPTNGLDPEGIKELRELITTLAKKENVGVLISSHNLAELENFCTDVCIIKNGEIIEAMSVKEAKKADDTSYLIDLDKTDGIEELLSSEDSIIDKHTIRVYKRKKEISQFIKKLIDKGYEVNEFKLETITLEDAFLKKAGGNKID